MKVILTLLMFVMSVTAYSCPVCEKQQPELTQGLTHGAGPTSNWDWVIVAIITGLTLLTFAYSLKYLILPGEKNEDHIKNLVLNNQCYHVRGKK